MTTAREIMTPGATFVDADATVVEAARHMAREDIGALPVCGPDGRLQGMLTDRDIALRVVAEGRDPNMTTVGELASDGEVVTIGADDSAEEAMATMKRYAVRRLPVIDGFDVVGMVSQADVARAMPEAKVGDLVDAISQARPNN